MLSTAIFSSYDVMVLQIIFLLFLIITVRIFNFRLDLYRNLNSLVLVTIYLSKSILMLVPRTYFFEGGSFLSFIEG